MVSSEAKAKIQQWHESALLCTFKHRLKWEVKRDNYFPSLPLPYSFGSVL